MLSTIDVFTSREIGYAFMTGDPDVVVRPADPMIKFVAPPCRGPTVMIELFGVIVVAVT